MAYVITQPAPAPVYIEQAPPPVIIQSPPAPVYIEQAPPPVIIQSPPAPVYIEQARPPVIIQTAVQGPVVVQSPMKSFPASTRCGFCQQHIVTATRPVNGPLTWTIFAVLLVFCIWPFCLIPFCVTSCKDIEHSCPSCRNVIHVHKRM